MSKKNDNAARDKKRSPKSKSESKSGSKSESTAQNNAEHKLPDPVAYAHALTNIAERSQKIIQDYVQRHQGEQDMAFNHNSVLEAFTEVWGKMLNDPSRILSAAKASCKSA